MKYGWAIGVALAALAAVVSNVGLNLQKWQHNRLSAEHERLVSESRSSAKGSSSPSSGGEDALPPPAKPGYASERVWQLGLFLIALGSLFDFAALAFAAQSVVAPLGSLTLVSNVVVAPWLLGERRTRKDVVATAFIVCGAAMSVTFAAHESEDFSMDELLRLYTLPRFFVLAALVTAVVLALSSSVVALNIMRQRWLDDPAAPSSYPARIGAHRFQYAALAGVVGAQSVLFSKSAAVMLVAAIQKRGYFYVHWQSYLILAGLGATIYLQLLWLNGALILFDALYVVPVFQTFWILCSVVGGLVVYGEYRAVFTDPASSFLFPLGVLVTMAGVYTLSGRADKGMASQWSRRASVAGGGLSLVSASDSDSDGGGSGSEHDARSESSTGPVIVFVSAADSSRNNSHAWSYATLRRPDAGASRAAPAERRSSAMVTELTSAPLLGDSASQNRTL